MRKMSTFISWRTFLRRFAGDAIITADLQAHSGRFHPGGTHIRYTDLIFDLYGTLVDIHTKENESA